MEHVSARSLRHYGRNLGVSLEATVAAGSLCEITGLTARTTPTAFNRQLPDWVAGTKATPTQARRNCTNGGFTGLAPTLAQYRIGRLDADLRCSGRR